MTKVLNGKKEELIELFRNTPARSITLEMCEAVIEQDGLELENIPKHLLSTELCLKAIEQNPYAFLSLKREYIAEELILAALKSATNKKEETFAYSMVKKIKRFKGLALDDFLTDEIIRAILELHPMNTDLLPRRVKENPTFIQPVLKRSPDTYSLVPHDKRTKEFSKAMLEAGIELSQVELKFREDEEIIETALNSSGVNYKHLPRHEQTYERLLKAIANGLSFYDIPRWHYCQELFDFAIKFFPNRWYAIPKEYRTKQIIREGLTHNADRTQFLKAGDLDEELALLAVSKGALIHYEAIAPFQTKEMVEMAVEDEELQIIYAKEEFITKDLLCKAIKRNYLILDWMWEREDLRGFIDQELCEIAVEKGLSITLPYLKPYLTQEMVNNGIKNQPYHLKFVDDKFKTEELCLKAFERDSKVIHFIPTEFITEDMYFKTLTNGNLQINEVKEECLTEELALRLVEFNWEFIKKLPKSVRTLTVSMKAYEKDERALDYLVL